MKGPLASPAGREALVLAALYFGAAITSMALSRAPGSIASFWLPNAVAIGFLVTARAGRWRWLFGAATAANVAANLAFGDGLWLAIAFVPANLVEIWIAASLLRRSGLGEPGVIAGSLRSPGRMLALIGLGAIVPQAIGASLAALLFSAAGAGAAGAVWMSWFQGAVLGSLSILAFVVCVRQDGLRLTIQELLDWRVGALACVAAGVALLSLAYLPFPFVYVALPPLLAAIVVEMGAALAITCVLSVVIIVAINGGVLVLPAFSSSWQSVLVYMAYAAALVPSQILAAAVAQMRDGQARLEATLRELRRTNQGLENFVHIASHDLREPLNTIVQFSALVRDEHGSLLPPEGQRWLGLVNAAGVRMRNLLDDVLGYVRMQREVQDAGGPVDLGEVLHAVQESLAARLRDSGGSIHVLDELPVVRGRASLLTLVFQNLLSNALKFVPKDRLPEVTVGWREEGAHAVVAVIDNGIGIAAADVPKLFKAFSRLHLRKHYDGTGLGLVMVRQIVEAAGGSVDVISTPGEGTCFEIRLLLDGRVADERAPPTRY